MAAKLQSFALIFLTQISLVAGQTAAQPERGYAQIDESKKRGITRLPADCTKESPAPSETVVLAPSLEVQVTNYSCPLHVGSAAEGTEAYYAAFSIKWLDRGKPETLEYADPDKNNTEAVGAEDVIKVSPEVFCIDLGEERGGYLFMIWRPVPGKYYTKSLHWLGRDDGEVAVKQRNRNVVVSVDEPGDDGKIRSVGKPVTFQLVAGHGFVRLK